MTSEQEQRAKLKYENYMRTIDYQIKFTEKRIASLDKLKEIRKQTFQEWIKSNKIVIL